MWPGVRQRNGLGVLPTPLAGLSAEGMHCTLLLLPTFSFCPWLFRIFRSGSKVFFWFFDIFCPKFAPILLLKQQNTKKLYGTKNSCMPTTLVLALGQPFLKGWGSRKEGCRVTTPRQEEARAGSREWKKAQTQPGISIPRNPHRKETKCSRCSMCKEPG